MHVVDGASHEPVFETDEGAEGQEAFHAGWAAWIGAGAARKPPLHEGVKFDSDPHAQHDESQLDRQTQRMGIAPQAQQQASNTIPFQAVGGPLLAQLGRKLFWPDLNQAWRHAASVAYPAGRIPLARPPIAD